MTSIIENFDSAAKSYDAHATAQAALATELAKWIMPIERKGVALEFGAGTGLLTRQLQPWKGSYSATDAAPQMVEIGRLLCPAVNWKVLDANTPQPQEPANWLLACNLLQWLENPHAVLQAWRKLLAPGGQFLVAIQIRGTLEELSTILPEASPLQWREPEDWKNLFEQAGLSLIHDQTWEHVSVHPSARELLRGIHAMGLAPRYSVSPGRLRTALQEYDRKFAVKGGVRATWRAWLGRGQAG